MQNQNDRRNCGMIFSTQKSVNSEIGDNALERHSKTCMSCQVGTRWPVLRSVLKTTLTASSCSSNLLIIASIDPHRVGQSYHTYTHICILHYDFKINCNCLTNCEFMYTYKFIAFDFILSLEFTYTDQTVLRKIFRHLNR